MNRTIQLRVVTSPDGTKCAAGCPFKRVLWCCLAGEVYVPDMVRTDACIAASEAAREAEVDALQRGYDIGVTHTGWGPWGAGDRAMEAEIERVRRGGP